MRRSVICLVRDEHGWWAQRVVRSLIGWRLEPESLLECGELSEALRRVAPKRSELASVAIGLDRSRLIVRTVTQTDHPAGVLPEGVDLVAWRRITRGDGAPAEVIACPRDVATRLLHEALGFGFVRVVLFPEWAVVDRAGRLPVGTWLRWTGGSTRVYRGGTGPWVDGEDEGKWPSGRRYSLRGGLAYALSSVPEGWSASSRGKRWPWGWVMVGVALVTWAVVLQARVERRVAQAELERSRLLRAVAARPGGCTAADLARWLRRAGESGARLEQVVFVADTLTAWGTATTHAEIDGLGGGAGLAAPVLVRTEERGNGIGFWVKGKVTCGR